MRDLDRRTFISCAYILLGGPRTVQAQPQPRRKDWRIGILAPYALDDAWSKEFAQALRDAGYVDGRNGKIESRSAGGQPQRYPAFAGELLQLHVDVILAVGDPADRLSGAFLQ